MKPIHEQAWDVAGLPYPGVVDIDRASGRKIVVYAPMAEQEKISALVSAAPDMARALLAFLPSNGHTMECGNAGVNDVLCSTECRDARQALRKAGVLP